MRIIWSRGIVRKVERKRMFWFFCIMRKEVCLLLYSQGSFYVKGFCLINDRREIFVIIFREGKVQRNLYVEMQKFDVLIVLFCLICCISMGFGDYLGLYFIVFVCIRKNLNVFYWTVYFILILFLSLVKILGK